jgi:peptidoglycan biosynthesis protein MviN/MurJ (putative lipid II flippase)
MPVSAGAAASGAIAATAAKKVADARAGVAMAIATFAMAGASALQAVLYLSRFGVDGRTDGFFVAFAVYTTFGVFGQSVRLTAVPLLVGRAPAVTPREFAGALALIAAPVLLATIALAGPLAEVLAPGLAAGDRAVTVDALPVLGGAMALQLWASGGATVLAVRGRFTAIAASYVAGAAAGLIAFLALMDVGGELTLGWSMLAMAVTTCVGMLAAVQRSGGLPNAGRRLHVFRLVRLTGRLLGRTAIYLAFNALFVVTLAFASHAATGDTTVLSYAYLFSSYLVAGTGMALGMSRIADMSRTTGDERAAVVAATVPAGFRYALLIVAPALGLLIVGGAPLIHVVLPGSLDADGVRSLQTFTALLVPWTAVALLVSLLMPALFALGRTVLLNALAVPLVLVHLAATAAGHALFGVEGSVGAMCVAPACFAAVMLRCLAGGAGVTWSVAGGALRFLGLGALAYGAAAAITAPLPTTAAAAAGIAVGSLLYLAGALVVARPQLDLLAGALRPRPA